MKQPIMVIAMICFTTVLFGSIAPDTIYAQKGAYDEQAQKAFDKTVSEALPALVDACKEAAPIEGRPIARGLVMLWNIWDDQKPGEFRLYRHDQRLPYEKRVTMPRDQGKLSTLVLIMEETEGPKSGFYTSGADAYTVKYKVCFVDWPEKKPRGTASMTSTPPSSIGGYSSMWEVHRKALLDWINW